MVNSFLRLDADGNIEEIDLSTGESRILHDKTFTPEASGELIRVTTESGEIGWVSKFLPIEKRNQLTGSRKYYPYSILLAEEICFRIANGETVAKIGRDPGMPSNATIYKWRKEFEEFEHMYKRAVEARAEYYFSKGLEIIENLNDPEMVGVAKLKTEYYKHASRVGNQKEFGEKTQIDAKIAIGISKLETGIRRPGDSGFDSARIVNIEKEFSLGEREDGQGAELGNPSRVLTIESERNNDKTSEAGSGGDNLGGSDSVTSWIDDLSLRGSGGGPDGHSESGA